MIIPRIKGATQPSAFSFFVLMLRIISDIALSKKPTPVKSQIILTAKAGLKISERPAQIIRKLKIK